MDDYADKVSVDVECIHFLYYGSRVYAMQTPKELGMTEVDELEVIAVGAYCHPSVHAEPTCTQRDAAECSRLHCRLCRSCHKGPAALHCWPSFQSSTFLRNLVCELVLCAILRQCWCLRVTFCMVPAGCGRWGLPLACIYSWVPTSLRDTQDYTRSVLVLSRGCQHPQYWASCCTGWSQHSAAHSHSAHRTASTAFLRAATSISIS